jgi:hypothetical protein
VTVRPILVREYAVSGVGIENVIVADDIVIVV